MITLRRGGTLTDADHRLLALWAATCAEHVLPLFEAVRPADQRPRQAIEAARAWTRGEIKVMQAKAAEGDLAGRAECAWQRDQLPEAIRDLVLDDQRSRNLICWSVFG